MNLTYGNKAAFLVFLMGAAGVLLRAYVLAVLWRWFAVPAGLPAIGMAHAYGLATLVQFGVYAMPPAKDRDIADAAREAVPATRKEVAVYLGTWFVRLILAPLTALACGYVARLAM